MYAATVWGFKSCSCLKAVWKTMHIDIIYINRLVITQPMWLFKCICARKELTKNVLYVGCWTANKCLCGLVWAVKCKKNMHSIM